MGYDPGPLPRRRGETEEAFDLVAWDDEISAARLRTLLAEALWTVAGLASLVGIVRLVW